MIVEMILTKAVDDLEQAWRRREAVKRWDDSDETCERLLAWLRGDINAFAGDTDDEAAFRPNEYDSGSR